MEAVVMRNSAVPDLAWNSSYQEPAQENLSYLSLNDNPNTACLKLKILQGTNIDSSGNTLSSH